MTDIMNGKTLLSLLVITTTFSSCLDERGAGSAETNVDVVHEAVSVAAGKSVLCHIPKGARCSAQSLTVAASAVKGHLQHGDYLGACQFCTTRTDGTACDDKNLCTTSDVCKNGTCSGTAVGCGGAVACHEEAVCDKSTGQCVSRAVRDGTACDDQNSCTEHEVCTQGVCSGGTTPGIVISGTTINVTCAATAQAIAGIVQPTCTFPMSLAENNVYTGTVYLMSHLDRGFAGFDVLGPITDGVWQLACIYLTAEGVQVGGNTRFVNAPGGCTAVSADTFVCSSVATVSAASR